MIKRLRKPIKMRLLVKMLMACLVVIAAFGIFWGYYALPRFQADKMLDKETKAKQEVELASGVVNYWYNLEASGEVTRGEAQSSALKVVGDLRYESNDSEGSFWVNDNRPVLLADATRPDLVNSNVSSFRDEKGNYIFRDIVDIGQRDGSGVYTFYRQKDGSGQVMTEVSYVESFAPWGWVIGTGFYKEEVIAAYRSWRDTVGWVFGGIAALCIFIFWMLARYALGKPLTSLVKTSEALAQGRVDQQIDIKSNDEIGMLASAYSKVIDYMKEMAEVSRRVADGDLTVEVKPRSEGDVLGNAFAQLIARQHALIGEVKNATRSVAEASRQLTKASEQTAQITQQITNAMQQLAKGASEQSNSLQGTMKNEEELLRAIDQIAKGSQEQAAGVEQASGMVKQVSTAIVQVSENARAGAEAWRSTAKSAENGARMTHETVEGMKKIKEAMDVVSLRVTDLGENSREIGSIVATIDDIAAQTNLLALNAAIEAARAGEQGRGFAVVADEVRKLAERSSLATKEIASLIGNIQAGVREAVNAMGQSTKQVGVGYNLATDAGKALDDILERSNEVGKQVDQISGAAQELNALSNEMVNVIEQINKIVEENAAATKQMTDSSVHVLRSIENVGSVAEENSASAQEVSASTEEMSAQVEEVLASAQSLTEMSEAMERAVAVFKIDS